MYMYIYSYKKIRTTYNYVGTGCGQNISVTNQIFEFFGNL